MSTTPADDEPTGKAFGHSFWMLNSIEAFERLAYFGIRSVVPLYIMQATEPGGLHLTAWHKGEIYAWWAVFLIWWPAAARAIYFISGRSPRRTALAALLLPLIWMGQQLLVAFIPISIAHWFLMISSTI